MTTPSPFQKALDTPTRDALTAIDKLLANHASFYAQHPLAVTVLMTEFFMDYLRKLHQAFDGDLTAALVLGEIGQANTRRFVRALHPDALPTWMVDTEVRESVLRGCNGLSVSMASGIPRETVRRKIKALEDDGLIAPHPDGGWAATETAAARFSPTFNFEQSLRLLETLRRIVELGLPGVDEPAPPAVDAQSARSRRGSSAVPSRSASDGT
jgi:DNA-binding transcriptional ArsR family regulator